MSKYKESSWRGTTATATTTAAQRHLNGGNKGGDGVEDLAQNDVVLPRLFFKKKKARARHLLLLQPARLLLLSDILSAMWCAAPRGHTSSSKGSHQQLQGTSKIISMASKRSCDPIDPTVAPPQLVGNY
ncbi:hypothetical protein COP1_018947 [Malus domestica]